VLRNNFISSPGGVGVNTRAAVGSTIDDNVIDLAYAGQDLVGSTGIAWALGSDALKITKNTIRNYYKHALTPDEPANVCGVAITSGSRIPDADALIAANTIDVPPAGSAARQVCGAPANAKPVASFTSSCPDLTCTLTSTSTDADGSIASYRWDFGDGTPVVTTTTSPIAHTFAAAGTYTVTLWVTDNRGGVSNPAATRTVTAGGANALPVAKLDYTPSSTSYTIPFFDRSTDSDGRVVKWSWSFGDGNTSTAQNPSHTFAQSGTYKVQLTVFDDRNGTAVSAPAEVKIGPVAIGLTASALSSSGSRRVDLRWTAASGASVVVRRASGTNALTTLLTTPDDGQHTDQQGLSKGTYRYQVCSTHDNQCSPEVSVSVR
jgi:PKD repeat protein